VAVLNPWTPPPPPGGIASFATADGLGDRKLVVTVSHTGSERAASVHCWRGEDGALLWDEATIGAGSGASAGAAVAAASGGRRVAVLAGGGLNVFGAAGGAAEWQLSE